MVTHHLEDLPRCITHAAVLDAGQFATLGALKDASMKDTLVRLFGS